MRHRVCYCCSAIYWHREWVGGGRRGGQSAVMGDSYSAVEWIEWIVGDFADIIIKCHDDRGGTASSCENAIRSFIIVAEV